MNSAIVKKSHELIILAISFMMNPVEMYRKRIEKFAFEAQKLQKRENRLSVARLIVFVGGIALFISLISPSLPLALATLGVCLILFAWLVKYYSITEKEKDFNRHMETINRLELNALDGNFFDFTDGKEYINRNHPNSYDLDLFGHASVFQYINRTTSKPAADKLAAWLNAPASPVEIPLRHEAVDELKPMMDWRQKLITIGYFNNKIVTDPGELITWSNMENHFRNHKILKFTTYLLSAFGILSTISIIIYGLPAALLIPVFCINFLFYFSQGRKISRLHGQVSRTSDMLLTYAAAVGMIEKHPFRSKKLTSLQHVFMGSDPVSSRIKKLSKLVNRLDARLNILVAIPLNLFFFWDIHCCLALENWKKVYAGNISGWFDTMAEFEVLACFANMAFNNPKWTVPDVVPEYFIFKAENAGHPLIPDVRRVSNSIEIERSGKTILVTGSNMSGKSTFLRTCGVNAVLALAGAPVCAASFVISHVQVFSSMRISDSLEDNTSSFYAELKRLASMIREAEKNQRVFLLLDEILRGTNSNDRYTGSVALIRQLIAYGTVSIVATHDLRLADLAKELPQEIDNYHFDVKIDGEELYFDYKLTPGICTSLNASILMKKMGIKM